MGELMDWINSPGPKVERYQVGTAAFLEITKQPRLMWPSDWPRNTPGGPTPGDKCVPVPAYVVWRNGYAETADMQRDEEQFQRWVAEKAPTAVIRGSALHIGTDGRFYETQGYTSLAELVESVKRAVRDRLREERDLPPVWPKFDGSLSAIRESPFAGDEARSSIRWTWLWEKVIWDVTGEGPGRPFFDWAVSQQRVKDAWIEEWSKDPDTLPPEANSFPIKFIK